MIEIIAYILIGVLFFISVLLTDSKFMGKLFSIVVMAGIFVGMKNYVDETWTFAYVKTEFESLFWVKYAIIYLVIGLVWFVVEGLFQTREIKADLKKEFDKYLDKDSKEIADNFIKTEMLFDKIVNDTEKKAVEKVFNIANKKLKYVRPHSFIRMDENLRVYFNKSELFDLSMNVILFFPLYVVDFIFGKMIKSLFDLITNFVINVCGGAIRRYFADMLR